MNQQNNTAFHDLPYTVRASWTFFIILCALGLLISFALLSLIGRGPSVILPIIVILCLLWVLLLIFMLVIGSRRIVLLPDSISYRTLMSRRDIAYTEIIHIGIDRVVRTGGARGGRAARYYLQIDTTMPEKHLRINAQVFSKRDIAFVINTIGVRVPSARLDESARQP